MHKEEVRHREDKELGNRVLRGPGKRISNYVVVANIILNHVIVSQKLGEIHLLFRGLNALGHEFLKAFMICDNDKEVAKQVLSPFLDDGCDIMKFMDVG